MAPGKNIRDVVIAGAGPAGCTLAYHLARRGIDVLVLEKAKLPRAKVCAGGITFRAASLLDFDIASVVEDTIAAARVSFNLRDMVYKECGQPLTYTVRRDRFDYLLASKASEAGAEINDGQAVIGLESLEGHLKIVTSTSENIEARILAGCDGASSAVARSSGLMSHPWLNVGLETEIPVKREKLDLWRNTVGLDFGYRPPGYAWAFPKAECLSIGAGGPIKHIRVFRGYVSMLLRRLGLNGTYTRPPFLKGHLMPQRRLGQAIVAGRCLLLGDAAGLIDPFTGEGIFSAVKSALLAAPVVEEALVSGPEALLEYQRLVENRLMPDLRLSRGLSKFAAIAPRLCFSRFTSDQRVWTTMCQLLRGDTTYSQIISKLGPLQMLIRLAAL
ncbi:MAG: NAD(P)/FAD-dependent oxidoreductase [Chloroflexi bacterium]|nr:NAD(P)/FAD-dependent oxidoreductase [Chloroflexota bacterium]